MVATAAGCAPPASLTTDSTQLQLHVARPRCTVTLIISLERKAKGADGEKQHPKPHYVCKITPVMKSGEEVGQYQYLLSQKNHSSYR